jgi:transcriptional regulator with XRE-family HTH domain
MLIGERIRESRRAKELTQQQLADILNVSKTVISGYENNTKSPTINNLEKLIAALDVNADYLFGRDVLAVSEDEKIVNLSKQDLEILDNIKSNRKLYHSLYVNPQRTIKKISKIIK